MNQKFHHYKMWEETKAGLWNHVSPSDEIIFLKKAIEFTGNADLYGEYMIRAVNEWPISCEQNLSNVSINRQAWIGHAACCIAISCPEYITRRAWHHLTQKQQDDANAKADEAIRFWENKNEMKELESKLLPFMEEYFAKN